MKVGKTALNTPIDSDLHTRFKTVATAMNKNMNDIVEDLVKIWLEENEPKLLEMLKKQN